MRVRVGAAAASAVAIGFALLTLVGLLLDGFGLLGPVLDGTGYGAVVRGLLPALLNLTAVTVAATLLVGLFNLFVVHLARLGQVRRGGGYSLVLITGALAVILFTVAGRRGWLPPATAATALAGLQTAQFAVEAALAGLLAVALVLGAARTLRRVTWTGALFVAALLIALLAQAGLLPGQFTAWLALPVGAGARGLLLGVALATVTAGLRVLLGQDRSYRE